MSARSQLSKGTELTALAVNIAVESYKILEKLPDSEQWDLQAKLRSKTVELVTVLSEAAGALDPRDITWRLGQARGCLAALMGLVKVAHKVGYIELNPAYMLNIEKAIDIIDEEIPTLPAKTKAWMATNYPTPDERGEIKV